MRIAYNLIRSEPVYRREAFDVGLKACGYDLRYETPGVPRDGDLLVIWNRYLHHGVAERFESAGAAVLVAENAYVWKGGVSPHQMSIRPAYALARSYHNDSSVVPDGGPERWAALGIELKPWRKDGRHILICPNRTFGTPGRIMPAKWPYDTMRWLQTVTTREVRMRPHPGNDNPKKPLADDLAGCHAMVIWGSSAGVHALVAGVPVVCCSPAWIAKGAAGSDLAEIESPPMPDRMPALHRLARAQWSVEEIAAGEAFRALLTASPGMG